MAQKLSQLAQELKPYIQPWIAQALGASGGTATPAVGVHDLGGALHRGSVIDSQIPQALLRDGSRSITGNIAMNDGKTIDGVDPSAHVADPNAHHNRSHSIVNASDHTTTGVKWQLLGVYPSDGAVGLITPSASATGTTEAVLKTSAAGKITVETVQVAGVIYADDTLDFGTDYMAEDATYLRVYGSKPVYFGQTVQSGSAWSINTSGDFAGRDVGGRDATFTEDLYAAATAFRVINHTHDYPHAHVIVNPGVSWTLDEQFGVDIDDNLLVRGYIVGKHALQVKDALLIAHYDGPDTRGNTAGNPAGHMGQPATVSGDVLYRDGLYGKAVEVTDAYTNLVSNPSFEADLTGWTDYSNGTAAGTRGRSSADSWDGTYSYRIQKTGGASADRWGARCDYAVTSGQSYVITGRVRVTGITGGTTTVVVMRTDTNVTGVQTNVDAVTDGWIELQLTTTATATGTARVYFWIANCTSGTFYFDAVQAVNLAYQVPYFGAARTAANLYYAQIPIKWQKCTLMGWVKFPAQASAAGRNLGMFEAYNDANNLVRLVVNNADNALYGTYIAGGTTTGIDGALTLAADTWHHVAIVIDNGTGYVYLNGALDTSASLSGGVQTGLATVYVGRNNTGARVNGMVDDFAVINRALPADEIKAIYESNAPIFAETSTWHWRGGRNRVWADAEGLWMLSADSNAVIGAYAGDDLDPAATKGWGGFTLGEGDIALGHNRSGSSGILWDRSAGTFGFYGNGGATPQVVIATDGTLYSGTAGAQRVQMTAGELAGYSSANVRQWYGDTSDGKFYAGGGKAWLDEKGFNLLAPIPGDLVEANYVGWKTQGNLSVVSGYITTAYTSTSGNPSGDMYITTRAGGGTSRITLTAAVVQTSSGLYVGGDGGGVSGALGLTNVTDTGISTGVGSVRTAGTTARTNTGWLKIYVGTAARYIPYWTTITG
jgi:hypothetical protein